MVDIVFDAEVYSVVIVGCRVGVGLRIMLRGIGIPKILAVGSLVVGCIAVVKKVTSGKVYLFVLFVAKVYAQSGCF